MRRKAGGGGRARDRRGRVVLAGARLESVELDVARGVARLRCEGTTLEFGRVRATTLLAPWDGAPGTVERVTIVAADAGELGLEVRVRYSTVPRVYRVVCGSVRRIGPPRSRSAQTRREGAQEEHRAGEDRAEDRHLPDQAERAVLPDGLGSRVPPGVGLGERKRRRHG